VQCAASGVRKEKVAEFGLKNVAGWQEGEKSDGRISAKLKNRPFVLKLTKNGGPRRAGSLEPFEEVRGGVGVTEQRERGGAPTGSTNDPRLFRHRKKKKGSKSARVLGGCARKKNNKHNTKKGSQTKKGVNGEVQEKGGVGDVLPSKSRQRKKGREKKRFKQTVHLRKDCLTGGRQNPGTEFTQKKRPRGRGTEKRGAVQREC